MSANGYYEPVAETQVPGSVEGSDDNMDVRTGAVVRKYGCCSCGPGGNKRAYITVFVLFVINLLNYMDRQTIAGTDIFKPAIILPIAWLQLPLYCYHTAVLLSAKRTISTSIQASKISLSYPLL